MTDNWIWHTERIPPAVTAWLTDLLGGGGVVELAKMVIVAALPEIIKGCRVADVVAVLSTLDVVIPCIDR